MSAILAAFTFMLLAGGSALGNSPTSQASIKMKPTPLKIRIMDSKAKLAEGKNTLCPPCDECPICPPCDECP